jgi:hypothetical protein
MPFFFVNCELAGCGRFTTTVIPAEAGTHAELIALLAARLPEPQHGSRLSPG